MKASKTFYKVSFILSIIWLVVNAITLLTLITTCSSALKSGELPYYPKGSKDPITADMVKQFMIFCIIYIVLEIAATIVTLVLSIKAPKANKKSYHIASIIFGALSSVIFPIPAGIIGLVNLNKKDEQKVIENQQ